jgi:hypothetical protein
MNQSFVIMAPYWDYNDEYSYTVGEGSGSPVAVFADRAQADAECERLELAAWRMNLQGESIGGWMWDSYGYMVGGDEDEAKAKLRAAFPDDYEPDEDIDLDDFMVPSKLTDAQVNVLRDVFSWIYFNHVVVVESH